MKHRSSLKKVRFDEDDNGKNSQTNDSLFQNIYNNNDLTVDNGYMIIPGGRSEEQLREQMRKNKEEWERSNMDSIVVQESSELSNKKRDNIGGSRNVRKRSSFKDKNAKYRERMKELNRGSIGHILDRLNIKRGLNGVGKGGNIYSSLPYRAGERDSRPDLIQSVMDADKNAGKEFTRRPSLEFFQDLRSQLNSGRKHEGTKLQRSDVPVTIFHNGNLRASRDNLQDLDTSDDLVERTSDNQSNAEITSIPDENVKEQSEGSSSNDIPVSRIDEDSRYRVVISGAELKKKITTERPNEKNGLHSYIKPASHQPHPQRKIKLPKGFIGILPKYRPQTQNDEKKRFDKPTKGFAKSKKSEGADVNFSTINSSPLPDDRNKEHYLIRTLPLPSLGSHGGTKSDKRRHSSDFMDSKQVGT